MSCGYDDIQMPKETFDLLKRTYQKPSQIYKYIAVRRRLSPFFLLRTLSYMREQAAPKVVKRETNIDTIAKRLLNDIKQGRSNKRREPRNPYERRRGREGGKLCVLFKWHLLDEDYEAQKTQTFSFLCPWCGDDYKNLENLMMHLKNWHLRFKFDLRYEDGVPVIDLRINTTYDGSYLGFKYPGHDLKHDFRFCIGLPKRREPQTQVIYFRSKRKSDTERQSSPGNVPSTDYDDEVDVDVCSGRLYYHTSSCLPVKPNEVDIDSEADMDPDWLQERTQLMIDEFTDVNEGEKEMLKLWNLHIMKNYKYKSDSMIRQACLDFVDREGDTILAKNLSKNLTLHLVNLHDFGLISSGDVLECIRKLRRIRPPTSFSPTRTSNKVKLERSSNEHCQHSPPAKRALLNSHCNQ